MDLHTSQFEDIPVLELTGRFDAYATPKVTEWMEQQRISGLNQLVINMTGVNFIDSMALASLVKGMKHCRQNEGNLFISNLQQPVKIIFELTKLNKAFDIFSTQTEAIEAYHTH